LPKNIDNSFRDFFLFKNNKMPRKKRQVAAPAEEPEDEMQVDDDENNTENPQDKNNQENNDDQEEDIGEEVRIPADPLEDFDLPENFFVPKVEENLGVGKLGEPRLMRRVKN